MPKELATFKSLSKGWKPELYEKRFTVPGSEVLLRETEQSSIVVTLPDQGDYFINVMPFDAHGKKMGRKLFPLADEVVIRSSF